MKLLPLLLLGLILGLLTSLLLPVLLVIWFDAWWSRHERAALLAAAKPSPAVRCDGDLVKSEQAFDYTAYLPEWWWN